MKISGVMQLKLTRLILVLCFCFSGIPVYGQSSNQVVRLDSNGNATAVWVEVDPSSGNSIIQTNYLPNGGNWSGPTPLSSTSYNSSGPQLAVNAGGDTVVIWISYDSSGNESIQGIMEPSNGSWGSVQTITSSDENIGLGYSVSISENGTIIASWNAVLQSSTGSVIRTSTSTISSNTWSGAITISS